MKVGLWDHHGCVSVNSFSTISVCLNQSLWNFVCVAWYLNSFRFRFRFRLFLWPMDSRTVCLGVGPHQIFSAVKHLRSSCWEVPSLTRGRVCNLFEQFVATLWSKSRRTHGNILLSHLLLYVSLLLYVTVSLEPPPIWRAIPQEQGGPVIPPYTGFPFCRLLRLKGLRWRHSNPPPHGSPKHIWTVYFINTSSESVCLYAFPHIVATQRLGKNVTAATNIYATTEEALDASFSMSVTVVWEENMLLFFPPITSCFLNSTVACFETIRWNVYVAVMPSLGVVPLETLRWADPAASTLLPPTRS
jgi:hypothetical protein